MRLLLIIFFIVSFFYVVQAQTPSFQWVRPYGSMANDYITSITIDNAGNSISVGDFGNTIDFDPGPPVHNLTSGGHFDFFISKLDPAGNLIWAKSVGGASADQASAVKTDNSGNIYISGSFGDVVDFDPGPAVFNMGTINSSGSFLLKLDINGNFLWAKQLKIAYPASIDVDANGNLYACGEFYSLVDFDPGPGVFNILSYNSATGTPIMDAFVLKLDATGNFVWAKQIGGDQVDRAKTISLDPAGDIVVMGNFAATADFDPGPGIYNLTAVNSDVFILKLDAAGNFKWAKQTMGPEGATGWDMGIDAAGNIFTGGYFNGLVDFNPGPASFTYAGFTDIFVLKLNAVGDFIWAKQIAGAPGLGEICRALTVDDGGNVYLAGLFVSTVDFDPGPGVYNLSPIGTQDVFAARLDNNGNFVWAVAMGSATNYQDAFDIQVDQLRNVYTAVYFWGTVDFDPGPGVHNETMVGIGDAALQKLSQCQNLSFSTLNVSACNSYSLNNQTYNSSGVYTQVLLNAAACDSTITLNLVIGGSTTNLSAVACDSYSWEGHTYTADGTYTVTYPGTGGCDSILNLSLVINHSVSASIAASICEGQSYAGYTATGTYTDQFVAANGCDSTRILTLEVKPRATSNITATICEGNAYAGYTSSGTYTDTYTASNGCDSIRTLELTVNPTKITSRNVAICEDENYFVAGAPQTVAGVYRDTLQTFLGCDSVIITTLAVNSKPRPNLGTDRDLCTGTQSLLDPGTFAQYLWQDGTTATALPVNIPGLYWVKVSNEFNCSASDSLTVGSILPSPADFLKQTDSVCSYEKLEIASLRSYNEYLWSTGSIANNITINAPGIYWLNVKDINGCTGRDSIIVFKKDCMLGLYIPTGFSPNKDGKNDLFKALVYGDIQSFRLQVFDRAGQLIFQTTDPNTGWDGSYKGSNYSTSVFIWQCSYTFLGKNPVHEKGTVMVIR